MFSKRLYLYIAAVSLVFSAEGRYISQESNNFYNFMFFLTISSDNRRYEPLPKLYETEKSNFLSIKEGLIIRNQIKEMLEEEDYEED